MSLNSIAQRRGRRRASASATIFATLVLLAIAGGAAYWQWQVKSAAPVEPTAILHTIARDDFRFTVTERGEIQAGGLTEVRSSVKSKNTPGLAILKIVPEGTRVKKDDFLVELDSSALQEELMSQQILVNTSHALVVEAQNVYETALIAKQEYLEGTFVQEKQTIESEIFVAEEDLSRATEYLAYSEKLAAKGYVNELQLQADRFAVENAKKVLETAETKLRVLEEFTKAKMLKQLESDIVISKSKWEAEKNSHSLEVTKLEDTKDQVAKTVIHAPQDGVVVYAHEDDYRGNNEFIVEEGAVIRERQTIIHLPDASSMRVELTVNEAYIQHIKPGMRATVRPIGLGNIELHGKIDTVNQYAEPTGWRKANVKEYKVYVSINEQVEGVRSGMTASVTVECLHEDDVVQTPVQSVFNHGKTRYCFVYDGGNWTAQEVAVGPTNDKFFVVRDGLSEGQRVAMDPKRYLSQVDLPEVLPEVRRQAGESPQTAQLPAAAAPGG